PEHDEKRAEETEPKRVQHAAGARAEQQVDARDGENEYQPDEAGQAGARQILSDVEVAKIFLEQAVEAQAGEPALELLRIRGAVAVRIEPMYVHTRNTGRKCQIRKHARNASRNLQSRSQTRLVPIDTAAAAARPRRVQAGRPRSPARPAGP